MQTYLSGGEVPFDDCAIDDAIAPPVAALDLADTPKSSGIAWLRNDPKVPVEVAASGPKVIAIAARHAERVMFTVGADIERLRWGIETARAAAQEAGRDPETASCSVLTSILSVTVISRRRVVWRRAARRSLLVFP